MAFQTTLVQGATKVWMIRVDYKDGIVSIENNNELNSLLKAESGGSLIVAKRVKEIYQNQKGKALNIGNNSLAIEILGHVYPDKLGNAIINLPVPQAVKDFVKNKLTNRTSIIDCGESDKDTNRWVWDTLAGYNLILV